MVHACFYCCWFFFVFVFVFNLATLFDHVTCRVVHGKPPGPNTVLTTAKESMLADWFLDVAHIGYGRSFEELRLVVKKILDQDRRQNPFTDNIPGPAWVKAFMRRHPFISLRHVEPRVVHHRC